MPLPPPETAREPLHKRSIRVDSYARDNGKWDLEAELVDVKAYDFPLRSGGVQQAGDPVHYLRLRITIDSEFTITDAVACYDAAPYGQHCSAIAPEYASLVGMNLLRNFRKSVKERYGRTAGCTHMTELSQVLPTVAVQTMANRRRQDRQVESTRQKRPFQLEGCHALRLDGPVVQEFYPRWYVLPKAHADD
jgi:hypothetical protein